MAGFLLSSLDSLHSLGKISFGGLFNKLQFTFPVKIGDKFNKDIAISLSL